MKVLVQPTIIVSKPVKNKMFGYTIILDQENPNQFVIKARSADGRGRGYAGTINREGYIKLNEKHVQLPALITTEIKKKINLTLDLIFGPKRDKTCSINERGLINFQRPQA